MEASALDCYFNRRETYRDRLRNPFAGGEAILNMEMNSILDILHCLFVGFTLAVAALQCWAGNKVSVWVPSITTGKVKCVIRGL